MLMAQVPVWTLAVTAGGVMLVLLLGLCLARCTRRRPDSCVSPPLRTPKSGSRLSLNLPPGTLHRIGPARPNTRYHPRNRLGLARQTRQTHSRVTSLSLPGVLLCRCRYRQFKESSLRDPLETADLPVSTGAEWGLQKSRWGASRCVARCVLRWVMAHDVLPMLKSTVCRCCFGITTAEARCDLPMHPHTLAIAAGHANISLPNLSAARLPETAILFTEATRVEEHITTST